MKTRPEGRPGCPRSVRGMATSTMSLLILLILALAALAYCYFRCCPPPRDRVDDGGGPSIKYVKLKNRSGNGQGLKPGMTIDWSKSSTGASKDGPIKHGVPAVPDNTDQPLRGWFNTTINVPPFVKAYLFTFELDDDTRFEDAPCLFSGPVGGFDIKRVEATLNSVVEDGTTKYWLEFEITYDDYYNYPAYPPNTGLTVAGKPTVKVAAGTTQTTWP